MSVLGLISDSFKVGFRFHQSFGFIVMEIISCSRSSSSPWQSRASSIFLGSTTRFLFLTGVVCSKSNTLSYPTLIYPASNYPKTMCSRCRTWHHRRRSARSSSGLPPQTPDPLRPLNVTTRCSSAATRGPAPSSFTSLRQLCTS